MKTALKLTSVIIGLALIAAACNHSREVSTSETTTTPEDRTVEKSNPCNDAVLEAVEIGVTADKITLQVMADVGSSLSPGLFQGAFDGTQAWVDWVNENGGLACREVELVKWDSKINPIETENGFLTACEDSLAQVGSNALFAFNVEALNTCDDKDGNPIGLPDFAEGAAEPAQQCSPNVFLILGIQGECPFEADEPRLFHVQQGLGLYLHETFGTQRCAYVLSNDLPSTINLAMPGIRIGALSRGTINVGERGFSGSAIQAQYGEMLSIMKEGNATCASTSSDSNSLLKWRGEAMTQGGFDNVNWTCFYQCYTKVLRDSPLAEGTYMWLTFLPYSERDVNSELDLFLTRTGKDFPDVWSALSWASGRLFQQVLEEVVAKHGVNGITRQNILNEAKNLKSFNANGWFGNIQYKTKPNLSNCVVIVQVKNKEFVRVHPEERGTLDCGDHNIGKIRINSIQSYDDGPSHTGELVE